MSLTPMLSKALDAVFSGLPNKVPSQLNLQTTCLPSHHPYYGSPWLCFVIRHATDHELQFVRDALDAGADPNQPHVARGCTIYPLHLAVKHGMPDVVKELLRRGAQRHALTGNNRSADDILEDIAPTELHDTVEELRAALSL